MADGTRPGDAQARAAASRPRGVYARAGQAVTVGTAVSGALARAGLSEGQASAGYAWNLVAGASGRKHTQGLYLEEVAGGDPVLHVYLDSSPLIQDFQTDHELFEGLLGEVGLPVSHVRFQLSRKTGQPPAEPVARPARRGSSLEACPALDAPQAQWVEQCSGRLEPSLAAAFRSAMEGVLRREGAEARRDR